MISHQVIDVDPIITEFGTKAGGRWGFYERLKFADPAETKRPGRMALRAEVTQAAPLQVLFRVSDNGIGMTPETMARIFSPFIQGESSITRRFGGTGLGLSICHRIVTLMGGDIAVESRPNESTTFSVSLPMTALEDQPRHSYPDLTGIDCLLVDSPELDRPGLAAYLEVAGARVIATTDDVNPGVPLVVILDCGDGSTSRETLVAPYITQPNVHAVCLLPTRGRRRQAREETSGVFTLDSVALRRAGLIEAVAMAAGRHVPEPHPRRDQTPLFGQGAKMPSLAEASTQGRLILVAEDDSINQKVILQQLALLGQRAEMASNGAEALRKWREGSYGLLLTDLHMPEMDGYTLTETIRREEAGGRRMPILALTANASRGEVHRAIAIGMDEYLTKPIRLQTLWTALRKWLPLTEAPVPAPTMPLASHRPESETTNAAVDITFLQGLVGNDDDIVREFLVDYLAAAEKLGAELGSAAIAGNGVQVSAVAHKLKSSSRTIGAASFADLCTSLEQESPTANPPTLRQRLADFEFASAAVDAECRAWLTRHERREQT